MRDRASRLRAIVRTDTTPRVDKTSSEVEEADRRGRIYPAHDDATSTRTFSEIAYTHPATSRHGHRCVDEHRIDGAMPLALIDRASASIEDWSSRVVFWDTETTGLSGGAGTLAFLVGCGWFEPEGFRVQQFLLTSSAGEADMLDAVGRVLGSASLLVSYNGRTFDAPLMEMRWAFHRKANPIESRPHLDMLPIARRFWGGRVRQAGSTRRHFDRDPSAAPASSCSLSTLERTIIGFHRHDDVPGFEIPSRYFQFLRGGDESVLTGVLEHNRHDLLSLAAVTTHVMRLAQGGPGACRDNHEQLAIGRLYERAGRIECARHAFECAASRGDPFARQQAFAHLAMLARRARQFVEAAAAWQGVLDAGRTSGGRRQSNPLERQAIEALAIHHEHRAHDLGAARQYAEAMQQGDEGRARPDVAHRLARIDRKIRDAEKQTGDPKAARMFETS